MGINFPAAPTVDQLYPDPAQVGIPQYKWNGTAWISVGAGGGGGLAISDTPPSSPTDGMMWWQSSTGLLYTRYNDQTTTQWVLTAVGEIGEQGIQGPIGPQGSQGAMGVPGPSGGYTRYECGGVSYVDISVPAGSRGARFTGCCYAPSAATNNMKARIGFTTPGVFETTGYYAGGHYADVPAAAALAIAVYTVDGFPLTINHAHASAPMQFEFDVTLKRTTGLILAGRSTGWTHTSTATYISHLYTSATAGPSTGSAIGFRFFPSNGGNLGADSYIAAEWF